MNREFILQKLAQLNANSGGDAEKTNMMWKPEVGSNQIRILPNPYNRDNPFTELYIYYNKFGKTFASPKSFGKPDPIDSFAKKLRMSKEEDSRRIASSIEPTMRTFCMVLVRGKESEGPKFWSFGKTVYTSLLTIMADPDYGDITDLSNGRDIVIQYKLGNGKDINEQRKNSDTSILAKPNTTPAFTEKEIADKMKAMPNTQELFQCPSEDELKRMLEEYLSNGSNGSTSPVSSQGIVTPEQPKQSQNTSNSGGINTSDIDAMFAQFEKEDKSTDLPF